MAKDEPKRLTPNSYLHGQVRRICRNSLIVQGIFLAVLLVLAVLLIPYFRLFFRGPRLISDDELLALAARPALGTLMEYSVLENHRLLPAGLVEERRQDHELVRTTPYFLTDVKDKLLLVRATESIGTARVVGMINSPQSGALTDREAYERLLRDHPELKDRLLPIMLDGTALMEPFGYIVLAFGLPALAFNLFFLTRALRGRINPAGHPMIRSLDNSGGDSRMVAQCIDAEVAGLLRIFGKTLLTENWILHPMMFRIVAIRLDEIVWSFIRSNRTECSCVFVFENGKGKGIFLKPANAEALLAAIQKRVPWAVTGWSLEIHKAWNKQRAQFLADVEKRKAEARGDA